VLSTETILSAKGAFPRAEKSIFHEKLKISKKWTTGVDGMPTVKPWTFFLLKTLFPVFDLTKDWKSCDIQHYSGAQIADNS
jgi:hypothetical protein